MNLEQITKSTFYKEEILIGETSIAKTVNATHRRGLIGHVASATAHMADIFLQLWKGRLVTEYHIY